MSSRPDPPDPPEPTPPDDDPELSAPARRPSFRSIIDGDDDPCPATP